MMGIKDLDGRLADATGLSSAPQIEPVPVSPVPASIPSATCDGCEFLGGIYWDDGFYKIHSCKKSGERRGAQFRSSGDAAEDFMSEFRKFYDARSGQRACQFYAERAPLTGHKLDILQLAGDAGKQGLIAKFFSEENRACGEMNSMFVDGGSFAYQSEPARGERRWFITDVGKAEIKRVASAIEAGTAATGTGAVHESAVPLAADAQTPGSSS